MPRCTKCCQKKSFLDFHKQAKSKTGYRSTCKMCVSLANKIYHKKKFADPVKLEEHRNRNRRNMATPEGRERHRISNLRYAKTHPNGSYLKTRSDSLFKLALNTRRAILVNLKAKKFPKISKTETILQCDFEFFHLYLEMQFKPGMTWANLGEWEIDHKIPISTATSIEDFNRLNVFTNLQPMWGKYNRMKNNMLPNEWLQYQKQNNINLNVKP